MASTNLHVTEINFQRCSEANYLSSYLLKLHTATALKQEPWESKKGIRGITVKGGQIFWDAKSDIQELALSPRALYRLCQLATLEVKANITMDGKPRDVIFGSVYLLYDSREPPPTYDIVCLANFRISSSSYLVNIIRNAKYTHFTYLL